jgi:MFS family permease
VEHSCEKCGAAVEDGRPFCPQCHAPQIHVTVAPAAEIAGGDGHDEPLTPLAQAATFGRPLTEQERVFDRRAAGRAALKAGLLGVFVGMIPFLGILLTGSLAVYFYRREKRIVAAPVAATCLGGAAGAVVSGINALFTAAVIVLHAQQKCIDGLVEVSEKFGINTATPQFQAAIRELFTPSGLISSFVITLVFASVGGALAAFLLRHSPRA